MLGVLTARRLAVIAASFSTVAALTALAATDRPAAPVDFVGVVERAQGDVRIQRKGQFIDVTQGEAITRRDQLATGANSRLLLSFNDGSRLALGENSVLVIADYIREEGRRSGALILDLLRGAIRLVAAKPQVAPDKRVELRTTAATINSRWVDLWTGPVDDKRAVLVIKGKVDVRNDAGLVTLDRKRLGTLVSNRLSAPEKPAVWPSKRASESLLTVAIK